jgi:hypothetical protein
MAISISSVADTLNEMMQFSGGDAITLNWNEFRKVIQRERIKEAFKEDLGAKMRDHGLLIGYGAAVVLIAKDYKFAPAQIP